MSVGPTTTRLSSILLTDARFSSLIARLALGAMILPHGLQKAFGAFGGYGFSGTMAYFTDTLGIPWILGLAAILAETVGGIALLVGFASRLSAAAVGITLAVAMLTVHAKNGFFMNWFGNQPGEGVEFFVLALALAAIVCVDGGGRFSLDRKVR